MCPGRDGSISKRNRRSYVPIQTLHPNRPPSTSPLITSPHGPTCLPHLRVLRTTDVQKHKQTCQIIARQSRYQWTDCDLQRALIIYLKKTAPEANSLVSYFRARQRASKRGIKTALTSELAGSCQGQGFTVTSEGPGTGQVRHHVLAAL